MTSFQLAFFSAIALSSLTVIADIFLKRASLHSGFSGWPLMIIAMLFYGIPAIGWLFVMRKLKLSTIGVIYSVTTVILLTAISVFYFREKISGIELVGVSMAITSIILLARFA